MSDPEAQRRIVTGFERTIQSQAQLRNTQRYQAAIESNPADPSHISAQSAQEANLQPPSSVPHTSPSHPADQLHIGIPPPLPAHIPTSATLDPYRQGALADISAELYGGPVLTPLTPVSMTLSNSETSADSNTHRSVQEPLQISEERARLNRKRSSVMGVLVGLMTAVGGFLYGYDTGVINSILGMQYVRRVFPPNGHSFSTNETAVITAVLSIGTFAGALSSPIFSDHVGRRWSLIFGTGVVFNVGIILQMRAESIPLLCIGRLFSGFGTGIISAVVPLYQAETAPKWLRGAIICFYQWAITWGLLLSSAIAQGTQKIDSASCYRIPIGIQLIPSCLLVVGVWFLPESPRWFVRCDRLDDAIMSLSRLRRLPPEDESLIEELIEIKASYDYEASFGSSSFLDCFRNSPGRVCQRKRMFTGIILQALQQCSGINFIFYYGVNFFVKTGVHNSYLISFLTYLINMVFTVPGILSVEVVGRRVLLIWGACGMTVCNMIIGIVGVAADNMVANKIMIVFVCGYIAFFASSWGPVCWVIIGELFNLSIRQKAVSVCAATNWFVNFIFAYATPYLIDTGQHTAALGTKIFFIWGSMNFVAFVFAYMFVYETKGLMLEDVDELYRVCTVASKSAKFRPTARNTELETENKVVSSGSGSGSGSGVEGDSNATAVGEGNLMMSNVLSLRNELPPSISSDDDTSVLNRPGQDYNLNYLAYGDSSGSDRSVDPAGEYSYGNQDDLLQFIQGLNERMQNATTGDSQEGASSQLPLQNLAARNSTATGGHTPSEPTPSGPAASETAHNIHQSD